MKKLSFTIMAIVIVIFGINCGGGGSSSFNPADSIPGSTAKSMYARYLDTSDPSIDRSFQACIKQTYLDGAELKDMLKSGKGKVIRVKLFTAAYPADYSDASLQNQLTVIVQLKNKKGSDSTYRYYDLRKSVAYKMMAKEPICPPPNDCPPSTIED